MIRNEELRKLLSEAAATSVDLDALTGRNRRNVRVGLWVLSGLKSDFTAFGVYAQPVPSFQDLTPPW